MTFVSNRRRIFHRFGFHIILVILIFIVWYRTISRINKLEDEPDVGQRLEKYWSSRIELNNNASESSPTNTRCTHYTCFDVFACDTISSSKIKVYVYPLIPGLSISAEYAQILNAIVSSEYYTDDQTKACLFVPPIDLLFLHRLDLNETQSLIDNLPYWHGTGSNHLIFNFIPGSSPDFNRTLDLKLGNALIASAGFDTWSFRSTFDIAIPFISTISSPPHKVRSGRRRYLFTSVHYELTDALTKSSLSYLHSKHPQKIFLLHQNFTDPSVYVKFMASSDFCLIHALAYTATPLIAESLMSGCVPVILSDDMILPFEEKIDWKRCSIRVRQESVTYVYDILSQMSNVKLESMRR